ncbi:MAG: AsmA-like C-terminal region-containing protein [Pirellulales bacterium]
MAALVGGGYLYWRLDDEICRHVERLFANHYTQLVVDVGSARFEQGQGVYVNNLSLLEPRAGGRPQPVLSIDELFLACDAGMEELMSGKPHLQRIVVRRPRLRAVRQADGRWNVAALVPLPKFSDDTPEMFIEDATLILEDATRHAVAPLSLRGIDVKLAPGELASASGQTSSRSLVVSGTASGAPARELTFTGTISPDDGTLELAIEIRGLEVSPELAAAIPGPLPTQLHGVELYASADATIHLSRTTPGGTPLLWSADVSLTRGRLVHDLLPQPVTELAAHILADSRQLVVKQLTGKVGAAAVALACNRQGWAANAPLGLAGRIQGLVVNSDLPAALPAKLEQLWQRFRPSGIVDAEVQLTFDGQQWRPELTAHCRGLSLTDAEKFPYTIEQASGTVSLTRSPTTGATQLDLDLVGLGDGRPIHIAAKLDRLAVPKIPVGAGGGAGAVAFGDLPLEDNGVQLASATSVAAPLAKPTGWVEVSGTGVSIHEQLLAALPEKAQPFVRSLRPQGLFDFRWRYERLDPSAPRGDTSLDLKLTDCAVQYERFPYPLQQVHGLVTARNGHYTLSDLVGRDRQGSAEVTCQGESEVSDAGLTLALVFRGTNVPLDENLKQSLSPQVQQVWSDLRPQGRVNFLAQVARQLGQEKPTIQVELQPHEQSVSVEPVCFPYRFEQVDGRAIVTDGRVDLQQLKGVHGRSVFTAQGVWQAAPGGGWQLVLSNLNADRLAFEPDFLRAVPLGVQKVIDRIRPSGNFNAYNSSLRFVRRPESPQIAAQWDLQLTCHQAALRGDLPLDNLTGGIRLMGTSDGPNVNSYGELAIDSLIWNDMQLTNIHGPLWSDSAVCYFGQQATAKLAQPPRRMTADVYGGTIAADAVLQHAGQPHYNAEISLGGVDLGRFVRERLGGPNDVKGTVSGKMSLAGAGRSTYALSGNGDLHVVDANIYQLPPLVAMLKVLRNRTPDSTAFDRCDAQFDLRGEHIHFQQLNLLGDAVSLYGRGETNFDRRLNLVFYTLVGPADLPIPLWKTVAGHLSEQGLQIQVDGTWDNPQIHREAFPMVNQMLEQIRTEAGQGAAAIAPPAAAGIPWVTPPR